MTDYERQLHDALSEVMGWIDNWSPSFVEDDEWVVLRQAVDKLVAKKVSRTVKFRRRTSTVKRGAVRRAVKSAAKLRPMDKLVAKS